MTGHCFTVYLVSLIVRLFSECPRAAVVADIVAASRVEPRQSPDITAPAVSLGCSVSSQTDESLLT